MLCKPEDLSLTLATYSDDDDDDINNNNIIIITMFRCPATLFWLLLVLVPWYLGLVILFFSCLVYCIKESHPARRYSDSFLLQGI